MLDKLLDNHLSPLDQLFLLNKEIYDQLDTLEKPIIVVGGPAFFKVVVTTCLIIKQLIFLDSDEPFQSVHSS